jgi:prepilin-type N-terminal cleavage/methylation domain-containing protein
MKKGFTLIELMIVIAIIAIIAAIAIPNLMESRVTANEAAASASLKSGVFPAQVQFQSGAYQDIDADNVGEYATLRALTGLIATSKVGANSIRLLQGPLATATSWSGGSGLVPALAAVVDPALGNASGYRFAGYAGSETDPADVGLSIWIEGQLAPTALLTAAAVPPASNANNGEKYWVVACAPEKFGDTGRRPFIISSDGQIRSPSRQHGIAAFYNATGIAPTNGNAVVAAGIIRGIAYSYDATNYPPAPAATAAAAAQVMAVTTFDTGATVGFEVFAK